MKFIVDAQLPRDLVTFLKTHGHEAMHTAELPEKNRTPDEEIRCMADAEDRIVVSKDDDFVTSHLLRGIPKRVLLISTGNISNPELIQIMQRGSLAETQYFLHLAKRLGYLDESKAGSVEALAKETFACLHGLILAVRKEA